MSVKGEKYKSKSAMMKHEKTEPMSARVKEYGKKAAKKSMIKKMGKKK
jgi:quinol monooxygenase YgiN